MSALLDYEYSADELSALKIMADFDRARHIQANHEHQIRLSDVRKKNSAERAAREAAELAILVKRSGSLSAAEKLFAQRRMPITMSREEGRAFCAAVNADEAKFNESKGRSGVVWCGD